jgi:PAS domain S-box-containing protein
MAKKTVLLAKASSDEVSALVHRLHETGQRLQELLAGQVDAVLNEKGQSYLLLAAQQSLLKSEAMQRELSPTQASILNALPAHIALLDSQGVIVSVNEGWRNFAGPNALQESASVVGQNYLEACERTDSAHARQAHEVAVGIRSVMSGAATRFALEYPCHSPTEQRWFQLMVNSMNGDGPSGAVVMHINITDRKRNESRFRRLVDSNAQSVFFWNTNGAVTGANDAFLGLLGYTRADLEAGRIRWAEITPPEYAADDRRAVAEAVAKGTCSPYEKEYIRKDGARVPILVGAAIFEDNKDEGVGFVLDLTERKKIEAQVRQAQKMEGIGELAGGVAHDFNNLLSAILGNTELAAENIGLDHPVRESLDEVRKAGIRAKELVQRILAFSRQQQTERRVLALGPLIDEVAQLLRATLPAKVELVIQAAPDAPNVLADATQIHQVILNLCTNAWHAMEDRAGRIEIGLSLLRVDSESTADGLRPGQYAHLTVTDNGKGMAQSTMEHLFEPFFTTKPAGQGTGLGLAVVDSILKSHKATITVASRPGEGTVFHLYFSAVEAPAENGPPGPAAPKSASGHGLHVLYVDDEDSLVSLGQRSLQRLGYQISGFTSATKALAAFNSEPSRYDMVVTDFNMPGMTGLELARELLRLQPGLPMMLVSGHITDELKAQASAVGIMELTCKPFTVRELGMAIDRMAREVRREHPLL